MRFGFKEQKEYPWHPDFRDEEMLPDIKVVRTDFILNFFVLSITLGLAIFYLIGLFEVQGLKNGAERLTKEIEGNRIKNQQIIRKASQFNRKSKILQHFAVFYDSYVNPLSNMILLSENKLEDMTFTKLKFFEKDETVGGKEKKETKTIQLSGFSIEGVIRGSYNEALDKMDKYMDGIQTLPQMQNIIKDIEMTSLRRDPDLGLFTYKIDLTLRGKDEF